MLKFDIIEWEHEIFKTKILDDGVENMTFFQGINCSLKDHKKSSFIIAKDDKNKIIGRACVLKKQLKDIQEDVRELVTTLAVHDGYVWECSGVFFDTSFSSLRSEGLEFRLFSQIFYRGLYEGLVEFGTKQEISFVIMKLSAEVYLATKESGLWPYVVELKPQNSPDGLFHGILPLSGSQYEAYQKSWEDA